MLDLKNADRNDPVGLIPNDHVYPAAFQQLAGDAPTNYVIRHDKNDYERIGTSAVRRYELADDQNRKAAMGDYHQTFQRWEGVIVFPPRLRPILDAANVVYNRYGMGDVRVHRMSGNPKIPVLFSWPGARVPLPYRVSDDFRAWASTNRPELLTVPYNAHSKFRLQLLTHPDIAVLEYQEDAINGGIAIPEGLLHPGTASTAALASRNSELLKQEKPELEAALLAALLER